MGYRPHRMKFGIFLAPFHEPGENPTLAIERDAALIEELDRLGYDEAWIGEHHSVGWEFIPDPALFAAHMAARTKQIKLGTGVVSLPYHNPLMVADRMMFLDHLTEGARCSASGRARSASDAYMMGIDPSTQRARMVEALEAIPAAAARRARHDGDGLVQPARRAPAARAVPGGAPPGLGRAQPLALGTADGGALRHRDALGGDGSAGRHRLAAGSLAVGRGGGRGARPGDQPRRLARHDVLPPRRLEGGGAGADRRGAASPTTRATPARSACASPRARTRSRRWSSAAARSSARPTTPSRASSGCSSSRAASARCSARCGSSRRRSRRSAASSCSRAT